MEWVSDKLKRRIWIVSSGTDSMYNKLFHAFIGQFDMTPHYFYELSREYMDCYVANIVP
jgi:hypothetical protein